MHEQSRQFFERYDYFVLPVTQATPFEVTSPYPTEIAGTPMTSYIDWMRSCWYITFMSNPAISVPGGFTRTGPPVGIQIVGIGRTLLATTLAPSFIAAPARDVRAPPCSEDSPRTVDSEPKNP